MKKYFLLYLIVPFFCIAQKPCNPNIEHVDWFKEFGTYYDMYVGNKMPYVSVYTIKTNNDTLKGKFVVDFGTDISAIDLDGFPGFHMDENKEQIYSLTIENGKYYSGPYKKKLKIQDFRNIKANGIRQAGIIGTDILSQNFITLDYDYSRLYIGWDTVNHCTPSTMISKGFVPVSTKGYYSHNNQNPSNIPTIPVVIGDEKVSAQALAQIDPGYSDRCSLNGNFDTYYTHILNINSFYYDLLKKNGVDINVDRAKFYTLQNISGNPDTLFQCSFSKKYTFHCIGTNGEIVIPYGTDECNVFLKVNAPGGEKAGGITTLAFPAVQFGGSILMDCHQVTFDPFRSLIWFNSSRNSKKN
jgi:hypothetical protein